VVARKFNLPTLTFLDFWSYYKERFIRTQGNTTETSFPDKLFVIDDITKLETVKIGIDENAISVVGSPHLESVKNLKELDYSNKSYSMLFISQPISELHGRDLGFNEIEIIEILISILRKNFSNYTLSIKPHPREAISKFYNLVEDNSDIKVQVLNANDNLYDQFDKHDVVLGIVSTALLEATILGAKTLSIQIGTNGKFIFFATENGFIPVAYSENEVVDQLKNILEKIGKSIDLSHLYKNATDKLFIETLKFLS
jgi:UDP-N-acetylglucosamine 2-epimerase